VLFYVLLGISSAITSIYFSQIYFKIGKIFKRWENPYKKLLIGGVLIGMIVYLIPPLFGEGYETINNILRGNINEIITNNIFHINTENFLLILLFLIGLVTFKVIAMSLTFGAGGIGGVFAPTLFTGSVSGYIFALVANQSGFFSHQLSPTNFAMVGMAGLMAGVLQAPLTAIFLIAEITGGYELFIPLMIVSSLSFIITKHFLPYSIYTLELAKKGELITHDKDKNVIMMMDFNQLIETDFVSVKANYSLGKMLKTAVAKSNRNLFPVVDDEGGFLGVVLLDDIRDVMFKKKMYKKTTVSQFMHAAPELIDYNDDNGHSVMRKFNNTKAWNLPVIKDGKYYGFISRSKMLTSYRNKLIEVTV
jgi:CIC family chloride channel protein